MIEFLRWYVLLGMAILAFVLRDRIKFNSMGHALGTCLVYVFFWPIAIAVVLCKGPR